MNCFLNVRSDKIKKSIIRQMIEENQSRTYSLQNDEHLLDLMQNEVRTKEQQEFLEEVGIFLYDMFTLYENKKE